MRNRFDLSKLVLLGLIFLGAGCATTRVDWGSRIGNYTYDQAVLELGVPDRQATLSDGTIVAEWLRRRGSTYGTTSFFSYSRFHSFDIHQFPDRFIRLIFGPDLVLQAAENVAK